MNGLDAYAGILLEMQEQSKMVQPPGWCLGTVLSVAGGLRIRADGQELDREDLLVDPRLLAEDGQPKALAMEVSAGSVTARVGLTDYNADLLGGNLRGTFTLPEDALHVGDQVVLLPDREGQLYYVVCKVVRP